MVKNWIAPKWVALETGNMDHMSWWFNLTHTHLAFFVVRAQLGGRNARAAWRAQFGEGSLGSPSSIGWLFEQRNGERHTFPGCGENTWNTKGDTSLVLLRWKQRDGNRQNSPCLLLGAETMVKQKKSWPLIALVECNAKENIGTLGGMKKTN